MMPERKPVFSPTFGGSSPEFHNFPAKTANLRCSDIPANALLAEASTSPFRKGMTVRPRMNAAAAGSLTAPLSGTSLKGARAELVCLLGPSGLFAGHRAVLGGNGYLLNRVMYSWKRNRRLRRWPVISTRTPAATRSLMRADAVLGVLSTSLAT